MEDWLIDNFLDFLDEIMEHPLDDDLKTKINYKIRDLQELRDDLDKRKNAKHMLFQGLGTANKFGSGR